MGNIEVDRLTTGEVIERANVNGGFPSGTVSIDLATYAVTVYQANVGANWIFQYERKFYRNFKFNYGKWRFPHYCHCCT